MSALKVKEHEIVDVLLGNADPALEARVLQAVREDARAAALYARWATVLPRLQEELAPVRELSERVCQRVAERLRRQQAELAGDAPPALPPPALEPEDLALIASYKVLAAVKRKGRTLPLGAAALIAPEDLRAGDALELFTARPAAVTLARRRRRRHRVPMWAACAATLLGFLVYLWSVFFGSQGEVLVATASGKVALLEAQVRTAGAASLTAGRPVAYGGWMAVAPAGGPAELRWRPLEPGQRLALPARILAGGGAQAVLRLPNRTQLIIDSPVELTIESPRRVRQASGTAVYHASRAVLRDNFSVLIPQATVEDLGTQFKVAVGAGGKSVVDVQAGRVRLMPARGAAAEATAGERAIVTPSAVTIEAQPTWSDLALERARFQTRLVTRGPAPQSFKPASPPAGVREVQYPSGALRLKAWLAEPPADGKRHPAVVYIHGGYSFAREDWEAAVPYAKAGYAVLTPMLRGENGNPGDYEAYYGEVDDAIAAGRYLASLPGVDPDKVFIAGHSIGGVITILAAMLPSPYAEAVAFGGSTDPGRLYHGNWRNGVPFDAADMRERLLRTPRLFGGSIRIPLHLVVGELDFTLQAQSRDLVREAERLGRQCKLWLTPGDHFSSLALAVEQSIKIFNERLTLAGGAGGGPPLTLECRPGPMLLAGASPLATLVPPHSVALRPGIMPPGVRKAPPFTSARPLFGVLRTTLDGHPVQAAIACDKKVSGRWRIYLDANLNGDLTDDPSFAEGEDFIGGQFFEAGLLSRNNVLWLRHPAAADPELERLEFVNRLYTSCAVELPGPTSDKTAAFRLNLFEGDGDTTDGALAVWSTDPGEGRPEQLVAMAAHGAPTIHAGRLWTLARKSDGALELTGARLGGLYPGGLKVGDPLPALEGVDTEGRPLRLAPPPGKWLLIYVWATWLSVSQRETPFSFDDFHARFKDRGLAMIGVSVDCRRQDLVAWLAAHPSPYPQLFSGADLTTGVAHLLGVEQPPTAILINPQGKVAALGASGEALWKLLDGLLPRQRVN